MGSGVSTDSKQLAKLEYLVQKKKPIDGSDCLDFDSALIEIGKLRTLCRLLDPQTVEDLLSGQKDEKVTNLEVMPVKESEEKEKEGDPILTLLQEKLDNRLISLREAFQKIDITGSGYITKEEFIQSCWYWGVQLEENDFTYLSTVVGSSYTRIPYEAFLQIMTKILDDKGVVIEVDNRTPIAATVQSVINPTTSQTTSEILRLRIVDSGLTMKQAFLKFDRNGSGSIEREEMREVLGQFQIPFTTKSLEDLFQRYDVNRDNKFQYGEFVRIIQTK